MRYVFCANGRVMRWLKGFDAWPVFHYDGVGSFDPF